MTTETVAYISLAGVIVNTAYVAIFCWRFKRELKKRV